MADRLLWRIFGVDILEDVPLAGLHESASVRRCAFDL